MRSATYTFVVGGDNYEELVEKADTTIARLTASVDDEDFDDERLDSKFGVKVNYELFIIKNEDITSEHEYRADVVAKIRDTNK